MVFPYRLAWVRTIESLTTVTGIGRFRSYMRKWYLAFDELKMWCNWKKIFIWLVHSAPRRIRDLLLLDGNSRSWLNISAGSYSCSGFRDQPGVIKYKPSVSELFALVSEWMLGQKTTVKILWYLIIAQLYLHSKSRYSNIAGYMSSPFLTLLQNPGVLRIIHEGSMARNEFTVAVWVSF